MMVWHDDFIVVQRRPFGVQKGCAQCGTNGVSLQTPPASGKQMRRSSRSSLISVHFLGSMSSTRSATYFSLFHKSSCTSSSTEQVLRALHSLTFWLNFGRLRLPSSRKLLRSYPMVKTSISQGVARVVLSKMGLTKEFLSKTTTETGTRFIDPRGKPFADFPVLEDTNLSPTSEMEILRGDLAKVLYDATKDQSNIRYIFGTSMTRVEETCSDIVRVVLDNGETQEYDLQVAADGQWSRVRKLVFAPEDIEVVDKGSLVAYWTAPRTKLNNSWWNIYNNINSKFFSTRPDPYGTIRTCFSIMPLSSYQKEEWERATRGDRKKQEDLMWKECRESGWEAKRLLSTMGDAEDFYFQAIYSRSRCDAGL